MVDVVKKIFFERFDANPLIVRSPGRVNIIGEHTDYNDGFVLPGAINKSVYIAVSKRDDDVVCLYAADFKEEYTCLLGEIAPAQQAWPNYILGVVDQLQKSGFILSGFNAVVDGDVPIGAGLSSSAAVECATIFSLNELFSLKLDKMKMVKLAQQAEHAFAGVKVGIMDMFASMFGKKDHVIKLNCRSLEYEYLPFHLEGIKIVLLNTNVKHSLASTEYNTRREQCEQGVQWIREYQPGIKSLRDVNIHMLDEFVLPKDKLIYQRCKFVVEEITRLLQACEDLKKDNIHSLGKKMFQTHEALSKEYEVSCRELDFLVDQVKNNDTVLGARMMGGGFGGCTINLVREHAIEMLVETVSKAYELEMHLPLTVYVAEIENGTSFAR
jgi:galactokinase